MWVTACLVSHTPREWIPGSLTSPPWPSAMADGSRNGGSLIHADPASPIISRGGNAVSDSQLREGTTAPLHECRDAPSSSRLNSAGNRTIHSGVGKRQAGAR